MPFLQDKQLTLFEGPTTCLFCGTNNIPFLKDKECAFLMDKVPFLKETKCAHAFSMDEWVAFLMDRQCAFLEEHTSAICPFETNDMPFWGQAMCPFW